MNDIMWMAAGSTVLLFWGVVIFSLVGRVNTGAAYDDYDSTLCAPSRRANITASVPQAQRRVLGPPAGWREPEHVAIVPAPAAVEVDDLDDIEDWDGDDDELPLAVEDWPTPRTVVVEPELVPVVNWTAARFAALEL